MKSLNKIINTLLVAISVVVAAIFIFGVLKQPSDNNIEQSSTSNTQPTVNALTDRDELTNRYMKEIEAKLRKEQLDSANDLKRAQLLKTPPKSTDEDWSHVPLEQQISKDHSGDDRQEITRSTAAENSQGITLNKDTAKDFIEAARRNGYYVILSDTYEVISITPIRNNEGQYDSFETHPSQ